MPDFAMPSLGADMQAGTLVTWRKQPGDVVKRGEIIAEVETEKGIIEVECFTEGLVEKLLVPAGTKVPVGTLLAQIRPLHAAARPMASGPEVPPAPEVSPAEGSPVPQEPASKPHVQATPAARKIMRERKIDARSLSGSGPHGTITRGDVVKACELAQRESSGAKLARPMLTPLARRTALARGLSLDALSQLRGTGPGGYLVAADVLHHADALATQQGVPAEAGSMRRTIAQAMARSKREIPHYYLSHTVDLGEVLRWLAAENQKRDISERLLVGTLFVRAVARALKKFPDFNAHWNGEAAPPLPDVNVGVAVSLRGGGLIAPAIRNTDQLSLDELSVAFKDLVSRARSGQLRSSEMSSATITLTSLGERGVETVFPIIVPPQVAMVGVGRVIEKPWVLAGALVVRPTVSITLAADHRVSDGHRGGLFLAAIASFLKEPPSS